MSEVFRISFSALQSFNRIVKTSAYQRVATVHAILDPLLHQDLPQDVWFALEKSISKLMEQCEAYQLSCDELCACLEQCAEQVQEEDRAAATHYASSAQAFSTLCGEGGCYSIIKLKESTALTMMTGNLSAIGQSTRFEGKESVNLSAWDTGTLRWMSSGHVSHFLQAPQAVCDPVITTPGSVLNALIDASNICSTTVGKTHGSVFALIDGSPGFFSKQPKKEQAPEPMSRMSAAKARVETVKTVTQTLSSVLNVEDKIKVPKPFYQS